MFKPEGTTNEQTPGDFHVTEHNPDTSNWRKAPRKLALAATVTCPNCGLANKSEWLTKSRKGDSYATTMFCEQCGSLLAVWAMHVDAQVVAKKPE